jgi:hypothetical protein
VGGVVYKECDGGIKMIKQVERFESKVGNCEEERKEWERGTTL